MKPEVILISDVHFSVKNLEPASSALRAALKLAADNDAHLFILGDLLDEKSIVRGEVIARIINILGDFDVRPFILRGNHDQLHEKSEAHSLEFLRPYATIIDEPTLVGRFFFIPYMHNPSTTVVKDLSIPKGATLMMHQGFKGASMGDYVVDKSSLDPVLFKDFKVFSGHYHNHQTVGTITYVGSPYTITFGEANDRPKGILLVCRNNAFSTSKLRLRQHTIIETDQDLDFKVSVRPEDPLWVKVVEKEGRPGFRNITKKIIDEKLGRSDYRLTLVPLKSEKVAVSAEKSDWDLLEDSLREVAQGELEEYINIVKELLS